MTTQTKWSLRNGAVAISLIVIGICSSSCSNLTTLARANELAIGKSLSERASVETASIDASLAKQTAEDQIEIPINGVEDYNFLSKKQILDLRSKHVARFPQLVKGEYKPSDRVFLAIEDGKPWWGMRGIFLYGTGDKSIEGPAEESRFLSNPFLLVGASPGSCLIWNTKTIPAAELERPDFPFCWQPSKLVYQPKMEIVETTYDISAYDQKLEDSKDWLTEQGRRELPIREFSLMAYNARDFGYEYIYVPIENSANISNKNDPKGPVEINQFIHCGNSSGYPGGCNNMSPERPPIDRFAITKLPASLKILLWKRRPPSSQTKPDLTMYMYMK